MNLVMVSAAAPPSSGSHATRVAAFITGLSRHNIKITLVTCRWPSALKRDSSLFRTISGDCRVIEASGGSLRAASGFAKKRPPGSFVGKRLNRLRKAVRSLVIPDTFMSWIPRAALLAARAASTGSAVILSSGAPFSAHVAAAFAARASRRRLVLDYGDPWVYEPGRPRNRMRMAVERKLERFVLSSAAVACFTTDETAALYRAKFGDVLRMAITLPMGFDPTEFVQSDVNLSRTQRDSLRIVYTGRVNTEYRSLDALKTILEALDREPTQIDVQFDFFGPEDPRLREELGPFIQNGRVSVRGNVDHKDFVKVIQEADGLMLLGNNNYVQVPGKTAQYLAARRPIFYFPNVTDPRRDPALSILESSVVEGLFVYSGMRDFFDFLEFVMRGRRTEVRDAVLGEYSWPRIVSKLASTIAQLAG